jgi:hypothetical protein
MKIGRMFPFAPRLPGLAAILSVVLISFAIAPGAPDDSAYKSIFCTVRAIHGIDTVGVRVPKAGSGECQLISISPTVISGPPSILIGPLIIHPTSTTVTTNVSVSPAPPAMAPGPSLAQTEVISARQMLLLFVLRNLVLRDIGTLETLRGPTYLECRLLTYDTDGIIIVHSQGIAKIGFVDLGADWQQKLEPKSK